MRLPLKEFMQMEAERLFNGRVLFMVSEGGFFLLGAFLGSQHACAQHEGAGAYGSGPPRGTRSA